jgi:predicted CXXCH cytochrome family protein
MKVAARAPLLGSVLLLFGSRFAPAQDAASCLECHALPDQEIPFGNGDRRSVTLDARNWEASAHGAAGLDCTACHTEHGEYPHPAVKDESHREYALVRNQACAACHEDQVEKFADGVHFAMLQSGNRKAAVCTDCHDPHAGKRLTDPAGGTLLPEARLAVPRTCARCHSAVHDQYRASAHGAALLGEGNPDVPTCIDCHGVHQISDPRTARFRVNSPKICASCHTDPAKMTPYGLSTAVLKTYVADFHGSTVTLFQKTRPDQQTNKPVCYDCHGVHDIPHTDDPQKGIRTKANLLRTCQQCHSTATANFPDAWMSHFIPDRERTPLVFWVGWLYRIFIPGTVGGMLLFVGTDFVRRRIDRRRQDKEKAQAPPEDDGETTA